jgi:L-alanine-DL-glutamate epimerase-like enolase superfamily enzyme
MTGFVKDGFKAVKMKIGHRDPGIDLDRILLVREAIGPDIDLMVDSNNAWSLTTAVDMAKRMEEFDIYWLEEPLLVDEIDNLRKLADETTIPIAAGENHYAKW